MKNIKYLIGALIALQFASVSCKEDYFEEGTEARIMYSFSVTGTSGTVFKGVIDEEAGTITLKVNPYLDAKAELDSVKATFYLSKGATVAPDPSEPQNFAQEGGVSYTVTSQDGKTSKTYVVSWGLSDKLADGEGFSYAEIGTSKEFPELGFPGEKNNFGLDGKQYGDLWMYHAYCGDEIVLYSRRYALDDPTAGYNSIVVDKTTLAQTGTAWNLGSISVANLAMITSDYHGHLVAAVENDANNAVEFFYWKKASDAPTSLGTVQGVTLPGFATTSAYSDVSANMQVVGDVTTSAWITALAPHSSDGKHYRIKVTSGVVESSYNTVTSGYSSEDCGWFQMVCPMDDSDTPQYAIADAQGTANAANSVHCYVNSSAGLTLYTMPSYWQNILQTWWVGTGYALSRAGGRIPISALPINGKTYIVVTSGTSWWHSAAVLNSDLQSLAHKNLNIASSVNRAWSFGSWVDWYYNEEEKEAYLAVWFGRIGLFTYKMTCYE